MLTYHKRFLPHYESEGAVYFVTFKLKAGHLTKSEIAILLEHIKEGDPKYYRLIAAQVMSNHVHLLLTPNDNLTLSKAMKQIKGASARNINLSRGSTGALWFEESFDRIVRDQNELDEKLNYMYENPLKAGIVEDPEEYWGWWKKE